LLVPALVSQTEETRVGINHLDLGDADENSVLPIVRTTGEPYLRMSIQAQQTTYNLVISTAQNSQRACSIMSPASTSDVKTPYRIMNGQGGEHGYFRSLGADIFAYEVVVQGIPCLEIRGSPDTLRLQVVTPDKANHKERIVAMAQLNRDDFPGGEHLEFRVLPGADAVLIVSVILGITLFRAGTS